MKQPDQDKYIIFKDLVIFSVAIVCFYFCQRIEMNFNAYQALRLSYTRTHLATPLAAVANKSSQSSVLVCFIHPSVREMEKQ